MPRPTSPFEHLFSSESWQDPTVRLLLDVVTQAPEVKLREVRDLADALGLVASIHLARKPEPTPTPKES